MAKRGTIEGNELLYFSQFENKVDAYKINENLYTEIISIFDKLKGKITSTEYTEFNVLTQL
jgi:hypothetical protein